MMVALTFAIIAIIIGNITDPREIKELWADLKRNDCAYAEIGVDYNKPYDPTGIQSKTSEEL